VKIAHSKVEQNFELGSASFKEAVDLAGIEIGAAMVVGSTKYGVPVWHAGSSLDLRDASVDSLWAIKFDGVTAGPRNHN
jgi:hypothetical protein